MPPTHFFRLLKTPIDGKGETLAAQIAALNESGQAEETFTLDPADFSLIPGSPFAYWVGDSMRGRLVVLPQMADRYAVRQGMVTADDFRFVRTWWEASPGCLGYSAENTQQGKGWVHFAKGGVYAPFYADVHLLVDWDEQGKRIRNFFKPDGRLASRPQNIEYFFRPGLTWPLRTTSRISVRAMPAGCIFSHKGPGIYVPGDSSDTLLSLLAVTNSAPFEALVKLQLGAATAAARSYEVGIIQRTPIPGDLGEAQEHLAFLAREAAELQRDRDRTDETAHAFCLPGLVQHRHGSLLKASLALEAEAQAAQARLAAIQAEIDDIVFDLYGLSEADRALVRAEMGQYPVSNTQPPTSDSEVTTSDEPDDEEEPAPPEDLPARVQNLLMWCVGVAFGRWDVRMALDPTLLPALQGPFDPLPHCAPGTLVGTDSLPPATAAEVAPEAWLRARKNVLDLPPSPLVSPSPSLPIAVAWDGILVDDPTHRCDIVTRVREVLSRLWGDRAGAIEREACQILGFKTLRDYFRDPRQGFFSFHIKRYSKSRRKAPIYWLLQSERRNYAIWLYTHRLSRATLYAAGRDYADAKVKLEGTLLEELKQGVAALEGSARKRREREIERQERLVAEVTDFRQRLDAVALLNLPPDLNDGVVISIAPLWEMVPWKEAQRTWEKLVAGEYLWSTMAQQMRERGLVRPCSLEHTPGMRGM